ncbi:Serine/threonine-protein phosphatase 4 regulatory subunit 1, partial [Trichinella zimbabwensis]
LITMKPLIILLLPVRLVVNFVFLHFCNAKILSNMDVSDDDKNYEDTVIGNFSDEYPTIMPDLDDNDENGDRVETLTVSENKATQGGILPRYDVFDGLGINVSEFGQKTFYLPLSGSEQVDAQNRRMLEGIDSVRELFDRFQLVCTENPEGLSLLCQFADVTFVTHLEVAVRIEVADQLPAIASLFFNTDGCSGSVEQWCIPAVVKLASDTNSQVRQSGQIAFNKMVQQKLLSLEMIEEKVIPQLISIVEDDKMAEEVRGEMAMLFFQSYLYLPREKVLNGLIPKCETLFQSPSSFIRKACAAYMGDMARVIGTKNSEEKLLPMFAALCHDSFWGTRKSCLDCYYTFSTYSTSESRSGILTNAFRRLVQDDNSPWVKCACEHAIGPFISSFADPCITGLSQIGDLVVYNKALDRSSSHRRDQFTVSRFANNPSPKQIDNSSATVGSNSLMCQSILPPPVSCPSDAIPAVQLSELKLTFDTDIKDESSCDNCAAAGSVELAVAAAAEAELNNVSLTYNTYSSESARREQGHVISIEDLSDQNIVPPDLLHEYLMMTRKVEGSAFDEDSAYLASVSFPGVVLALGRSYWYLLKGAFVDFSQNNNQKIRRTLSCSMHVLAMILGPEISELDLVPIFIRLMRDDMDTVRIGALEHLYEFILQLESSGRRPVVANLSAFLESSSPTNWRFRQQFVDQLTLVCSLCTLDDVNRYLSPISLTLAIDKVAEVRERAFKLIARVLSYLYKEEKAIDGCITLADQLAVDIVKSFGKSLQWRRRQSFCKIIGYVLSEPSISLDDFKRLFLATFVELLNDKIPHVRISGSRIYSNNAATLAQMMTEEEKQRLLDSLADDEVFEVRLVVADLNPAARTRQRRAAGDRGRCAAEADSSFGVGSLVGRSSDTSSSDANVVHQADSTEMEGAVEDIADESDPQLLEEVLNVVEMK